MKIKIKKLHDDAIIPVYASDGAACFDLYAIEDFNSFKSTIIAPTGLAFEIPLGYEMVIRPRSGMAFGAGIHSFSGTIDSDYRGEVKVLLFCDMSTNQFSIKKGQRIAQAVIQPVLRVEFECVDELSETVRGTGGFGSTGAK